jgi:hypothetical protein
MTFLFGRGRIIKVNVANGSKHNILCRVIGVAALNVQGTAGGSLDIYSKFVNIHWQKDFKLDILDVTTPGYTEIQIGNALEFELRSSSKRVYMTVISQIKNGRNICENKEIRRSQNYILNSNGALLLAKKNKKWIDTDGNKHRVPNEDEDST